MEKFKFYFKDIDTGTIRELEYDFGGWDSAGISVGRTEYGGFTMNYTSSYTFIKSDAEYLKNILMGNNGINKVIHFIAEELTDAMNLTYTKYYEGKVDFTTAEITSNGFEVEMVPVGLFNDIANKADEKVLVECTDKVSIDGDVFTFKEDIDNRYIKNLDSASIELPEFQDAPYGGYRGFCFTLNSKGFLPSEDDTTKLIFSNNEQQFTYVVGDYFNSRWGKYKFNLATNNIDIEKLPKFEMHNGEMFRIKSQIYSLKFKTDIISSSSSDFQVLKKRDNLFADIVLLIVPQSTIDALSSGEDESLVITNGNSKIFIVDQYQYYAGQTSDFTDGEEITFVGDDNNGTSVSAKISLDSDNNKMTVNFEVTDLSFDITKNALDIQNYGNDYYVIPMFVTNLGTQGHKSSGGYYQYPKINMDFVPSINPVEMNIDSEYSLRINSGKRVEMANIQEVLEQILGKITNYHTSINFSLPNGVNPIQIAITSVNNLKKTSSIFAINSFEISLNDFNEFIYKQFGCRMCVAYNSTSDDYEVSYRPYSDLFNDGSPILIEDYNNYAITPNSDLLYTEVKVGNSDDSTDGFFYNNSTTASATYKVKNTRNNLQGKTLDLSQNIKCGAEFIESELYKNYGETTTKNKGSNTLIAINYFGKYKHTTIIEAPENDVSTDINQRLYTVTYPYAINTKWYYALTGKLINKGSRTFANPEPVFALWQSMYSDNYYIYLFRGSTIDSQQIRISDLIDKLKHSFNDGYTTQSGTSTNRLVVNNRKYGQYAWNVIFNNYSMMRRHNEELSQYFGNNLLEAEFDKNIAGLYVGTTTFNDLDAEYGYSSENNTNGSKIYSNFTPSFPNIHSLFKLTIDTPLTSHLLKEIEAQPYSLFKIGDYQGYLAFDEECATIQPLNNDAGQIKLILK